MMSWYEAGPTCPSQGLAVPEKRSFYPHPCPSHGVVRLVFESQL